MDEKREATRFLVEKLLAAGPDATGWPDEWIDAVAASPALLAALDEVDALLMGESPMDRSLTCAACERLLDAYVEDWLDDADVAHLHPRVHQHLQTCADCSEQAQMLYDLLRVPAADGLQAPGYLTFAEWRQRQTADAPAGRSPSLWQRTAEQAYCLVAEIPLWIERTRASFGDLPAGLSPRLSPATALRNAADAEESFTELLALPYPEENLVLRLRIGPFTGGIGALIVEIGAIEPAQPIPQARVTLRDERGDLLEAAASDAAGRVVFGDLETGKYQFHVEHAGQLWTFTVNLQARAPENT